MESQWHASSPVVKVDLPLEPLCYSTLDDTGPVEGSRRAMTAFSPIAEEGIDQANRGGCLQQVGEMAVMDQLSTSSSYSSCCLVFSVVKHRLRSISFSSDIGDGLHLDNMNFNILPTKNDRIPSFFLFVRFMIDFLNLLQMLSARSYL